VNILERNKMTAKTAIKSALTAAQRNYMTQRLNEVATEKRNTKHKEIFGTEQSWCSGRFNPTKAQVIEAIKKGKATLKKERMDCTGDIDLDYDLEWADNETAKKEWATKSKAYDKFVEELAKKQQFIMDGVMLGTADDAMAALEAFAK
jgi:hypothetical protein